VALAAAGVAFALRVALPPLHRFVVAALVLGAFGALYLGATWAMGVAEARALAHRAGRLVSRR